MTADESKSRRDAADAATYLRAVQAKYGLTRRELADLASVSLHTIHSWMLPVGSAKGHRAMPERARRLLKHELRNLDAKKRRGKKKKSSRRK